MQVQNLLERARKGGQLRVFTVFGVCEGVGSYTQSGAWWFNLPQVTNEGASRVSSYQVAQKGPRGELKA